jgi:hypothetical protein
VAVFESPWFSSSPNSKASLMDALEV